MYAIRSYYVKAGGETKTVVADDEYIKNSILDPNSEIVEGFNKGLMQPYQGQLSDTEISQIT